MEFTIVAEEVFLETRKRPSLYEKLNKNLQSLYPGRGILIKHESSDREEMRKQLQRIQNHIHKKFPRQFSISTSALGIQVRKQRKECVMRQQTNNTV